MSEFAHVCQPVKSAASQRQMTRAILDAGLAGSAPGAVISYLKSQGLIAAKSQWSKALQAVLASAVRACSRRFPTHDRPEPVQFS
jgi:hypothetical protein